MRHTAAVSLALLAFALCGCPANRPAATFQSETDGHSHERGNFLLADAGHYHAALTAHLSAQGGNELHVFFENIDSPPKPVAIPLPGFRAVATTGDRREYELIFEPAFEDQRKDDPEGKCSHFVAKAPWLKPDDVLRITAAVMLHAKPTPVVWKDFSPKKYAQHID